MVAPLFRMVLPASTNFNLLEHKPQWVSQIGDLFDLCPPKQMGFLRLDEARHLRALHYMSLRSQIVYLS